MNLPSASNNPAAPAADALPAGVVLLTPEQLDTLVYAAASRAVTEALAKAAAARSAAEDRAADELLDAERVGAIVGMSVRAFRRLASDGRGPHGIRIAPKIVRWRRGDVTAWLKAGATPEAVPTPAKNPPSAALKHRRAKRSVFEEARERESAAPSA